MDNETLNKANSIVKQIEYLEGLKNKLSSNGCVHLQLQDHYGNKGPIIPLYGFKDIESEAIGDCDGSMRELFREFLEGSVKIIEERIIELQRELKQL